MNDTVQETTINNTPNIPKMASDEGFAKRQNYEFMQWDDLDKMNVKVLRGIHAYGFEQPSPIQKKTIWPIIEGRDVIGQAQSGTGKTGAFCIGTLNRIDWKKNATQAIILSPTHELARQHMRVCKDLSQYTKARIKLLIGGTSIEQDVAELNGDEKPQIIVGCPGRIHDMIRRKHLVTKDIHIMCIDEADEMLSSCFKEQVYHIFQNLNSDIQVALFSATMPEEVKELTQKFMRDPITTYVKSSDLKVDKISQFYIALTSDQQKYEVLKDLFSNITISKTIIYCNSVKRVQDLHDALKQDEYPVSCIHSNFTEEERKDALDDFMSGKSRVLISSDITARGIDVPEVNIVVNFDLCKCKRKYLHRVGRSGRWGRRGVAINFITRRDTQTVKEIEEYYETQFMELPQDYADKIKALV